MKECKKEIKTFTNNKTEENFTNISNCMRNVFKNHYDPL
jgi:hypothetical protein